MRSIGRFSVCVAAATMSALAVATPAVADNPSCPSGFTSSEVIHIVGGHYRAKGCYNRSNDDFAFQDTYVDGWSADFSWPQNSNMNLHNDASDKNGANNGWIYEYASYPSGVQNAQMVICSFDYSAMEPHGCTSASFAT